MNNIENNLTPNSNCLSTQGYEKYVRIDRDIRFSNNWLSEKPNKGHALLDMILRASPVEYKVVGLDKDILRMPIGGRITGKKWEALRQGVISDSDGRCSYCGKIPDTICVDHVIPKCKGGLDVASNLVVACKTCNSSKGGKLLSEWNKVVPTNG